MRWTGIAVTTRSSESEEAVTHLLLNAGCGGVAVSEEGEARQVTAYLPADEDSADRLRQVAAALTLLPTLGVADIGEPVLTEIDEQDWANSWKAYFKPLRIGRNLIVSPPWETPTLKSTDLLITIDPGMAFGTGTHATTQLCLILLEEYIRPGVDVADIGTGSGILSIASAKLGASRIVAVDNDPLAVRIAAENCVINSTDVVVGNAFPTESQFDIVVANIIADTLIALAEDLASITKEQGLLIVSGVIDDRQDDVRIFVEASGFTSLETRTQGEWVALVFRRAMA
jgi:ribosomal protein L11 methyltransferase